LTTIRNNKIIKDDKMIKLHTRHIVSLLTVTILVGCGGTSGDSSTSLDSTNTGTGTTGTGTSPTAQCRTIEPTLQTLSRKYALSKDDTNYQAYNSVRGSSDKGSTGGGGSSDGGDKGSSDSGGSHNEGRACLSCHSFASAGTVFGSLNARDNTPGAAGYRIKLSNGVVYATARGTGNSRSSSFPAGNYTAQVIDPSGNVVNSSASNSHDASRRDCNRCHTSSGNSGAPGRITSKSLSGGGGTATVPAGATATSCVSFNSNVMPVLNAKCKSCHGSNGRFTVTTANATHANITALKGSATAGGTYLNDKGSNTQGHGGGNVISTSSAEYATIKAWVSEGALNN
jgi:hypothetical protein